MSTYFVEAWTCEVGTLENPGKFRQDICINYQLSVINYHCTQYTERSWLRMWGKNVTAISGHLALTETQQNNLAPVPLEYHIGKPWHAWTISPHFIQATSVYSLLVLTSPTRCIQWGSVLFGFEVQGWFRVHFNLPSFQLQCDHIRAVFKRCRVFQVL